MSHSRITEKRAVRDQAFTLIEVLVALLVLSIGLLGLAALQNTALQFNTDSYQRTQATLLAYDILDRMRANPSAVSAGNYDVATPSDATSKISTYEGCKTSSCSCGTSSCSAANLATYDLGKWYEKQKELQGVSPSGTLKSPGTISRSGTQVTVTLRWIERDLEKTQKWVVQL